MKWTIPSEGYHAHFDCFSGAAGDMLLASCLDVSNDPQALLVNVKECLQKGIPEIAREFDISISKVQRGKMASIAALYVQVQSQYHHAPAPIPSKQTEHEDRHSNSDEQPQNHDHNHSHIHGHEHSHSHSHEQAHDHHHDHSHEHDHNHPQSAQQQQQQAMMMPLRNLHQIRDMLQSSSPEFIDPWVRDTAIQVFTELAHAEAQTHGAAIDMVHFHEVGAIDSIVDTVGTLIALHALGVKTVTCSRLPLGEGTCWGMHGLMPVPAPATLRLLEGMPTTPGPPGITGELVTPTGAALLRVLVRTYYSSIPHHQQQNISSIGRPPSFTIRAIGHGAGTKDFDKHPNIVRLILGDMVVVTNTNTTNSIL